MKIKLLTNVNSLEELRKMYYALAKVHHPDIGGTKEAMQEINNEYEYLSETLLQNANFQPWEREREWKTMEHFPDIINLIIDIPGVTIEIIGVWIWVTGSTFEHRVRLKEAGFKFSHNKLAWFWHVGESRKMSKKVFGLDETRSMFGSQKVENEEREKQSQLK